MAEDVKNRDLVVSQGNYAYMQDTTKGGIKVYTGPCVVTPTTQEKPVRYKDGKFTQCATLEEAVCKSIVAPEGYYITLLNPAKKGEHPNESSSQSAVELDVGRKVHITGPAMFSLWPGQSAELTRGHQLRSNQYLLVRVYNEEEAKKNWSQSIIKRASVQTTALPEGASEEQKEAAKKAAEEAQKVLSAKPPPDLTVGSLFIMTGTEVSFYIPPTGVAVVPESVGPNNKPIYARDALSLERLEYAILIDENGKNRYSKGPAVVFPNPTERFVEVEDPKTKKRERRFRAIELNELQGIHIKVIAGYEEGGETFKAGEELFITGKDTAIYYPREEHSAIKYDGKTKHFATAIPAGEARYVMNRMTGDIKMVKGPSMLLPDPRTEIIVRRILSDKQVTLWYPENEEARLYNADLRIAAQKIPTTRTGALSEGDVERSFTKSDRVTANVGKATRGLEYGGPVGVSAGGTYASSGALIGSASFNVMEQSLVSKEQNYAGAEFERASTHTQPRTITLYSKYQGVPTIELWTGFAVMVVSKSGARRVVKGPATIQLAYDESMEIIELSTGRPKTTDKLLKTPYLRVDNNKVSDLVLVETSDHVKVQIKMSYLVNFEGETPAAQEKWFAVENYVKFLCDHARSVLKGHVQKIKVEEFFSFSTDIIRDTLLGKEEGEGRPGMRFVENNMHVNDVEVLEVIISDNKIREMLDQAQHDVVKTNIELSTLSRNLFTFKEKQKNDKEQAETETATRLFKNKLEMELLNSQWDITMKKLTAELEAASERQKLAQANEEIRNVTFSADLDRTAMTEKQRQEFFQVDQDARIAYLKEEVEAVVKRFQAIAPGMSEALLTLSNNETLIKISEAMNLQRTIGGDNVVDALNKVFANTPLSPIIKKMTSGTQLPLGAGVSNGGPMKMGAPAP